MADHQAELLAGERFAFGENWSRFLRVIDAGRIDQAERSLQRMLECDRLDGRTFLDVGSGSGIFSLAARRLGATVRSFDFDPQSVACTAELRRRYFAGDPAWTVGAGSVLDPQFLATLGQADVVYSWGVLHHTGAMWQALANVVPLVAPHGRLFIAIYNDQGGQSRRWKLIKHVYNKLPSWLRPLYVGLVMGPRELRMLALHLAKGDLTGYFTNIAHYAQSSFRGMSYWHDLVDWVGGYPFEVARPEQIFAFYRDRGFALRQLVTNAGGVACNEFVFEKA